MSPRRPHYLLYSQANAQGTRRRWSFVLQTANAASEADSIRVEDTEDNSPADRLELLSVVRGLEALPQPARVTLVTPSDYVRRGIRFGLEEWRANNWQWERYGEMVPVKNLDLWRRVDRALTYHQLDIKRWRADNEHATTSSASSPANESIPDFEDSATDYLVETYAGATARRRAPVRKPALVLYMLRKIRVIRLRFVKRLSELWQSVNWLYEQARTPLLVKAWEEPAAPRRLSHDRKNSAKTA